MPCEIANKMPPWYRKNSLPYVISLLMTGGVIGVDRVPQIFKAPPQEISQVAAMAQANQENIARIIEQQQRDQLTIMQLVNAIDRVNGTLVDLKEATNRLSSRIDRIIDRRISTVDSTGATSLTSRSASATLQP